MSRSRSYFRYRFHPVSNDAPSDWSNADTLDDIRRYAVVNNLGDVVVFKHDRRGSYILEGSLVGDARVWRRVGNGHNPYGCGWGGCKAHNTAERDQHIIYGCPVSS